MKSKRTILSRLYLISAFILLMFATALAAPPSDEADVRGAVQRIFDQLKTGQYEALYDSLPSSSRTRLSRDQLVKGLQRTSNLYQLQRIEIGAVRVSGNLAVVDTVMYAHVAPPFNADGKLVVQQYLVREEGSWRMHLRSRNHRPLPEKQPEFRAQVSDQAATNFRQAGR
jgi:hypothetical protein